jgi:LysM domain-containing protein
VLPFRPRRPDPVPEAGWRADGSLRQAAELTARTYPVRPAAPVGETIRTTAPLRLTRRGYVVLGLVAAALTAGVLWLAHASAPAPHAANAAAVVTVQDGDTLWSIASRVAPERDPRTVVADLERLNHLSGPDLRAGQVLHVR